MRDLTEREKIAHQAARDAIKHLITLSTASLGVIIAIFSDLINISSSTSTPLSLWWSILCFGLSVLCGTFALNSLTGNIEKKQTPSIYDVNVTMFAIPQILLFVLAIVLAGIAITN